MNRMTGEVAIERMDILAAQIVSLTERANCLERVARELRTEAAYCSRALEHMRTDLWREASRKKVRRLFGKRILLNALRKPA